MRDLNRATPLPCSDPRFSTYYYYCYCNKRAAPRYYVTISSSMDALDGYGSSSSSDDDDNEHETASRGGAAAAARSNRTTAAAAATAQPATAPVNHQKRSSNTSNIAHGKKILSLASVLPPHILERLTRAGGGGGGDDDSGSSDDSSSDDDKNHSDAKKKPTSQNKAKASSRNISNTTDPGISSLLSDLRKARPEHDGGKSSGGVVSTTRKPPPPQQQQPLGAAFLTSVTTTVNKSSVGVRNIHDNDDAETKESDLGTQKQSTTTISLERQPASKPAVSTSLFTRINAAPGIHAAPPQSSSRASRPDATSQTNYHSQAPPSSQSNPTNNNNNTNTRRSSSRSKKEMERALRQGKVSEVFHSGQTQRLQAVDPTAYTPTATAAPAASASTVRNVPTQMYDPATGQTVTLSSSQQQQQQQLSHHKGKNQINQLLSQAAHLEQQRLQQPPTGAKMHRANAKRKYGW